MNISSSEEVYAFDIDEVDASKNIASYSSTSVIDSKKVKIETVDMTEAELNHNPPKGWIRITGQTGDRYYGEIDDDQKFHGQGVFMSVGDRYDGQFEHGKFHGFGVLRFDDGDRYDGWFRDGKRNGYGVMMSAAGHRIEGFYKDNKQHGHGIFKLSSGDGYEGKFVDGMQHGDGVLFLKNGVRVKGTWEKGDLIQFDPVDLIKAALYMYVLPFGVLVMVVFVTARICMPYRNSAF